MTTLTTPQDVIASEETLILSDDIPVIAQGFSELGLSDNLLKALFDMNFINPSSIQKEAIPQVLSGNDIIAKAPTGSGKTAAFAIPIIEKLDLNNKSKSIQALVLCPTRELAIQVHREFEKLTKYFENLEVVSVYGGQHIEKQLNALKKAPQIIVATPGRLMDHLRRGSIKLNLVNTVVLDEADEMLDMGFREDIYTILEETSVNRQTILFSATMAKDIMELTNKFQKSPNVIDVTDNLLNTPNIEQQYFEVVEKDKIELLTRLLHLHNVNLSLIFCNTKNNVDKIVEILKTKGYFADAIHGDMNQTQREKVMYRFRNGSVKILVATDVAGRGIDVKNIEAVFNYDLPRDDEDYIHRIGRTGRAGTSGIAFTFVSKKQVQSLRRIERANGIQIHKKDIPTFEELQVARISNFKNKIKSIINEDDLSEYKNNIKLMIEEGFDTIDIASALLKFYISKEGKKINKNIVFEVPQKEISEKRNPKRIRNRNNKIEIGNRENKKSNNAFQSSKKNTNKSGENISIDGMIMSIKINNENNKNRKKKSSEKSHNKAKSKFFGNVNKKSKSKPDR
jgi:ATP-dependent RNA helicase DeaD